jgi:hypothetical protein
MVRKLNSKKNKTMPKKNKTTEQLDIIKAFNENLQKKAERLYQVRRLLEEYDKKYEQETTLLRKERDEIQEQLIFDMKAANQKKVETLDGVPVSIKATTGIEIIDNMLAFKWAVDNRAVSINKLLVKQKLENATDVPPGFKLYKTEYISVGKKK